LDRYAPKLLIDLVINCTYWHIFCRQRGQEGWSAVFMVTVWSQLRDVGSTPTLIVHVVASLDKVLYDDYVYLVASNKQQIQW